MISSLNNDASVKSFLAPIYILKNKYLNALKNCTKYRINVNNLRKPHIKQIFH